MKFSCYKGDLADALQFAMQAVAVKPMTPILSGIYLKAEGNWLELHANDNRNGILTFIPVNTEVAGETVVSGKRFQEFVKNMPDDTITCFTDDNYLTLESGGASVELLTMHPSDFPKVKAPAADKSFKIRATTLKDLIRKTAFAVASEKDGRPIFTGVSFLLANNMISLAATNTHRLAQAQERMFDLPDAKFVVPADTLRGLMARIEPRHDNFITITYSESYLTFRFDNVFMTARLIAGEFPPFDKVIPKESTTRATVDVAEFKQAVWLVGLMSKETQYNTVKLSFSNGGVEVSANSNDVGGAVKNVEAQIEGDDLDINFNVNYILDVLRVIDSKELNIALNDKYSPAAFTEPGNDNFIYVATPVRA